MEGWRGGEKVKYRKTSATCSHYGNHALCYLQVPPKRRPLLAHISAVSEDTVLLFDGAKVTRGGGDGGEQRLLGGEDCHQLVKVALKLVEGMEGGHDASPLAGQSRALVLVQVSEVLTEAEHL